MQRTIRCGLVCADHIGTEQICCGQVSAKREEQGVIFLDVSDGEGVLRVVVEKGGTVSDQDFCLVKRLESQTTIAVQGVVKRIDKMDIQPSVDETPVALYAKRVSVVFEVENAATCDQTPPALKKPMIDVTGIANLARLYLNDQEKEEYAADMNAIITFANTIESVDTSAVQSQEYFFALQNVFREDEPHPCQVKRDALLEAAPTSVDGYITVPRIMES